MFSSFAISTAFVAFAFASSIFVFASSILPFNRVNLVILSFVVSTKLFNLTIEDLTISNKTFAFAAFAASVSAASYAVIASSTNLNLEAASVFILRVVPSTFIACNSVNNPSTGVLMSSINFSTFFIASSFNLLKSSITF